MQAQNRGPETGPDAARGSAPRGFRAAAVLVLAIALGSQLAHSLPRWDAPLVDGRQHVVFDNAGYLLTALHSNTPPPPGVKSEAPAWLRWFGTARYAYDAEGRVDRLTFYVHHPLLAPVLFRLWTQGVGYAPRSARSFALAFSLATTLLLWASLARRRLGAALTPLACVYALLPLPYLFVDVWKYEGPANLVLLAAVASLPEARRSVPGRAAFLASLALLPQADWYLYPAVPVLLWPLWRERRSPQARGLLRAALATLAGSGLLNLALLYPMGFDLTHMGSQGGYRMSGGLRGAAGWLRWAASQLAFLHTNLGSAGVVAGAGALAALFHPRLRRPNELLHGALCFATILPWLALFRSLSLHHHFVQWSLAPALVLLLGGVLENLQALWPEGRPRAFRALWPALALLALLSLRDARQLERRTLALAFGSAEDVAAVQRLRCRRLLIASGGESGPAEWWESPVILAALDPIWRGDGSAHCRVARLETTRELAAGDVLAVARGADAARRMQALLPARSPQLEPVVQATSPAFVFLEFEAVEPAG